MRGERTILYYVSGHGYGHATRASEIVRALARCDSTMRVVVRTDAPAHFFDDIANITVQSTPESLDPGVVEKPSALEIDVAATVRQIERCFRERKGRLRGEAEIVRRERVSLVVADFPPLAGDVAAAAGVPCLGIGNFTWDWIYEPFLDDDSGRRLLAWIRDGYAKMEAYLRLPFSPSEGLEMFRRVERVPLVARRASRRPEEALSELRIDPADGRPRVLLAMRGRIPAAARAAAAEADRGLLFLHFEPDAAPEHENCHRVSLGPALSFGDVLSVCDAVVSKLGYGILSECVAAGKALLAPPRRNFREEEVFDRGAARYVRLQSIPAEEFAAGQWSGYLHRLLSLPPPLETMATNGAEVCAEKIGEFAP